MVAMVAIYVVLTFVAGIVFVGIGRPVLGLVFVVGSVVWAVAFGVMASDDDRSNDRGATAVEFALLFLLMAIMVLVGIQLAVDEPESTTTTTVAEVEEVEVMKEVQVGWTTVQVICVDGYRTTIALSRDGHVGGVAVNEFQSC